MAEMGEDAAEAMASTEAASTAPGLEALTRLLDRLDAASQADRTLGTPRPVGARMVLPLVEVWYGHGFGVGGGTQPTPAGAQPEGAARQGYGGGGGGGGRLRPIAVLEVGADGTRVHPVIDVAAIGLAVAPVVLIGLLRLLGARARSNRVS